MLHGSTRNVTLQKHTFMLIDELRMFHGSTRNVPSLDHIESLEHLASTGSPHVMQARSLRCIRPARTSSAWCSARPSSRTTPPQQVLAWGDHALVCIVFPRVHCLLCMHTSVYAIIDVDACTHLYTQLSLHRCAACVPLRVGTFLVCSAHRSTRLLLKPVCVFMRVMPGDLCQGHLRDRGGSSPRRQC